MKVIAINGSPRTNRNTATLLKHAVEGARSKGAEVEVIDLYRLNYKGCMGCFSCKRKGSPSLHSCAVRDELTPVLEKIKDADGVIFASPIYLWDVTGEMHSLLERLIFQYLPYDTEVKDGTYFPKKLKTAFLYTMGSSREMMAERTKPMEDFISTIFRTPVKTLYSCTTYPFVDEWRNYEASDLTDTMKRRDEVFPKDCEKAFRIGAGLVSDED